uniref:Histone-lysine N-methyltransferase n=1 Tax=Sinocyclocheilus anshuiensis TaxID=1608454 RepID=A0A671MUR1_9TELE
MAQDSKDCRVSCKLSWEDLQAQCRRERLVCKQLSVSKNNFNDYEVEYLCNYKKHKSLVAPTVPPYSYHIPNYMIQITVTLKYACSGSRELPGEVEGLRRNRKHMGASQKFLHQFREDMKVMPGVPIYECNSKCRCGPDCANRVVQKGIQYDLCVLHQIITTEEAERRGVVYDKQGVTYLLDLDYVDHEINKSLPLFSQCDPNLQVYNVLIDNLNERLPRIAFFAKRGIKAGEELTFDYKMTVDQIDAESSKLDSDFSWAGFVE